MKLNRLLTTTALLATALVSAPIGAQAAADTTPPTLDLPTKASFVTGTTIGPMALVDGDPDATAGITMRATWTATDTTGICDTRSRAVYAGMEPGDWAPTGSPMTVSGLTDYEDQFGGGSLKLEGYDVEVGDCSGHTTVKEVRVKPVVFQEDGSSFGYGTIGASYSGSWGVSHCECWSGGTARKTTSKGARATFTVDSTTAGQPVALVMESAANRGKAQVLVDGVLKATIDTRSSTTKHRRVVWTGTLPSAGQHTVTVVNLATAGRTRIDIDALLVSS